ncbi:MAG: GDSL-type esterase/lipase family protein [Pseudomonadota bacterium]
MAKIRRQTRTGYATSLLAALCLTACAVADVQAQEAAVLPAAETVSTKQIVFGPDAPFASEIYSFFVEDEVFTPTACRTVFTGSSSIRFWMTLEDDFPDLDPLNRGFGGSQITDVIGYFDVLLTRHAPKEIVFYAGENDLNAGVSAAQTLERFKAFMELKADRLGDAPVYFLSAKPSVARLEELAEQTALNTMVQAYAEAREDLIYVDIASPMLEGGTPKPIFISDQLHMTLDGYAIWTDVLSGVLSDPDRPKREGC